MKIGIIGSGNIGGTLTRRLTGVGHDVMVANSRGPASLKPLTDETGAMAATVEDAARRSDLVVLALPVGAVTTLPLGAFTDKVVIDADNYYPERDGDIGEIADQSLTSSRWTADHFPDAQVVKAFNTVVAPHLLERGRPAGEDGRIAVPVAGDEPNAKRLVMGVVDELGFDPVDAGTLDESWRLQPNTPTYLSDHDAAGVRRDLGAAQP